MSNYTSQTAALKAVTIDTAKIDAKQIDTKKLFINGKLFNPSQTGSSQIKESPNEAVFQFIILPTPDTEEKGVYTFTSAKSNQNGGPMILIEAYLQKGSQTEGAFPNGVYALIQIDDNFAKCLCEFGLGDGNEALLYIIPSANFTLVNLNPQYGIKIEQSIFENFITMSTNDGSLYWVIKICEEDDELSELYGGITDELPYLSFLVSIPYYIPEFDTSSSNYSLRKTNPIDSIREKFEQMGQQILDKYSE